MIKRNEWRALTTGAFQDFVRFSMSLGDGVGAGDLPRIDDRDAVLSAIDRAEMTELVTDAWRMCVPKRVAADVTVRRHLSS